MAASSQKSPNTRDQLRGAHDRADEGASIRVQPPLVSCIALFGDVAHGPAAWLVVILRARDERVSLFSKLEPGDAFGPDGRPLLHRPAGGTEVVGVATLNQLGNAYTWQLHDELVPRTQHREDLAVNPQSPRAEAMTSVGNAGLPGKRCYDACELRHQGGR